jgi:hypothetical protein
VAASPPAAVDHRLGGDDRRLVAAQLDLGVEDDPEGVGQVGVGLGRPGAPGERGLEVVATQLEQAAGDHGVGVAGREAGRPLQHPGSLGVEGRVGRLPGPGHIGDAEAAEQAGLVGTPAQLGLEPGHDGAAVGGRDRRRRPGRAAVAGDQEPADQDPGGHGDGEHGDQQAAEGSGEPRNGPAGRGSGEPRGGGPVGRPPSRTARVGGSEMESTDPAVTTSAACELGNCGKCRGTIFSMTEAHGSPCSHECQAEALRGLSPVVRRRARDGLPVPADSPGPLPAGRRES